MISLFLLFQGACYFGLINHSMLMFPKFETNNYLILVQTELGKYGLILGVLGLIMAIIIAFDVIKTKDDEDVKLSKSYWVLLFFYALIALFTVV